MRREPGEKEFDQGHDRDEHLLRAPQLRPERLEVARPRDRELLGQVRRAPTLMNACIARSPTVGRNTECWQHPCETRAAMQCRGRCAGVPCISGRSRRVRAEGRVR